MDVGVGVTVAGGVLAAATVFGTIWRARTGWLHAGRRKPGPREAAYPGGVTLMQFSSPTCAPCERVRAVCAEVVAGAEGVRHVEIDVAVDLDRAREYGVWRVPTLLVLDPVGRIVRRAVGVPRRGDLQAAIAEVMA